MSWVRVAPVSPRARPAIVAVSLFMPPSQHQRLALRLRIGVDIVKAAGLAPKMMAEVLWGDEERVGSVLVRPAEDGRSMLKVPGDSKTGALECATWLLPPDPLLAADGRPWSLVREVRKSAEGPWELADGGLAVRLPAEWWSVGGEAAAAPTVQAAVPTPAAATPAPVPSPHSDPLDPKLQDMARHLLTKGCTLPELRARLRLDEAGFKVLCEALRAARTAPVKAVPPAPRIDTAGELARIREATAPPARRASA